MDIGKLSEEGKSGYSANRLPDNHIPDICYKQWCKSMNKNLCFSEDYLAANPWLKQTVNQRMCEATQQLIDDFKGLDQVSCGYLVYNFVPLMRSISNVRQHAEPELEGLLSEFKEIVEDAYEKQKGSSVEDVVSAYDVKGSSLIMQ